MAGLFHSKEIDDLIRQAAATIVMVNQTLNAINRIVSSVNLILDGVHNNGILITVAKKDETLPNGIRR